MLLAANNWDEATDTIIYTCENSLFQGSAMNGQVWTTKEIAILRSSFEQLPTKRLMVLLPDRSYDAIRRKARKIGLKHDERETWTTAEETTLSLLYPKAAPDTIMAAIPNHSWKAIHHHAEKLGIARFSLPLWKPYEQSKLLTDQATEFEKGYIVGMLEGEGTVSFHFPKGGKRPHLSLSIANTNLLLLKRAQEIIGGSISNRTPQRNGRKTCYTLAINRHNTILKVLCMLREYLIEKKEMADLAISYLQVRSKTARTAIITEKEKQIFKKVCECRVTSSL